jgi:hypothetical protein
MKRPNLKQQDFDEVDRLVAIVNASSSDPILSQTKELSNIRIVALERAAEIMGITKGEEDVKKTD